jgi:hypothetical protein
MGESEFECGYGCGVKLRFLLLTFCCPLQLLAATALKADAVPGNAEPWIEPLVMAIQVADQLNNYVTNNQLSSIHNEDLILGFAISGLRTNPPAGADKAVYNSDIINFGVSVSVLHSAADAGDYAGSISNLANVRQNFKKVAGWFDSNSVTQAVLRADRFTCPMHPKMLGKRTDLCPRCGMDLEQQIRVLPRQLAGQPLASIRASISTARPLQPGQKAEAILELKRENGMPLLLTDLIEAHTEKIHLLIIEPSLKDYHHEHPRATEVPGRYSFSFTPARAGNYRAWADIRPGPLGLQEYAVCDINPAPASTPLSDKRVVTNVTVDGLQFELSSPRRIVVGKAIPARLRVSFADGTGFTRLEPVMATFAHLVGFYEDYQTVLHMHPKGPPITNPGKFGGPDLDFQIFATKSGFVRLFAQVQIAGVQRFAPLGIEIYDQ